MFEKILVPVIAAVGTAIVTVGGVVIAKLNGVSKKFDKSVTELKTITDDDIRQALIEKAVEEAADEKVDSYIRKVRNEVMDDARTELKKEVSTVVNDAKTDIRNRISDELSDQASKIDMAELRKSVRDKAEESVLAKFDDNMQDILDKLNSNLSRIQKVYSNLEEAMSPLSKKQNDGKVTFTLN